MDDVTFSFRNFMGVRNNETDSNDEMPHKYDASEDQHAREGDSEQVPTTLDTKTLRHNIMRSYIEVSEWLGDGATAYGSHNGFVSRKMSMAWLFCAIRALINWKLANQDKWAEVDIHPLVTDGTDEMDGVKERFLHNGEESTQGKAYDDEASLNQSAGCCATQEKQRAKEPWKNGVLKVRGNEYHYGERAWFYTHNSFVGECRFYHNARFLG